MSFREVVSYLFFTGFLMSIISCHPSRKNSSKSCLQLTGCDQFKCLMVDCWCVESTNPILYRSEIEVKKDDDLRIIMEAYFLSLDQPNPTIDQIADLGHGWFNVFYKNDISFTIGPGGIIYKTTCGV